MVPNKLLDGNPDRLDQARLLPRLRHRVRTAERILVADRLSPELDRIGIRAPVAAPPLDVEALDPPDQRSPQTGADTPRLVAISPSDSGGLRS